LAHFHGFIMEQATNPRKGLTVLLPASFNSGKPQQLFISAEEFHWQFARSSGPGGQNVNKVATKAILRWNPLRSAVIPSDLLQRLVTLGRHWWTQEGELLITSQTHRQQQRNVEACLEKLRQLLVVAAQPPKVRKKTKPTRGARERRLTEKRHQRERKARRRMPGQDS
jgi:ribosome-associated protein